MKNEVEKEEEDEKNYHLLDFNLMMDRIKMECFVRTNDEIDVLLNDNLHTICEFIALTGKHYKYLF